MHAKSPTARQAALSLACAMVGFLVFATCARAERFGMMISRGPIPYLQGQPIIVAEGRLTAGDYANPTWGDYIGDGKADLLLGSDYGDLVLYEQTAELNFGPPQVMLKHAATLTDVGDGSTSCPKLCDLDSDGKTDLLLGHDNGLLVYWGYEQLAVARQLLTADNKPLFGQIQVRGLAPEAVDFDGDGDLDLLIGDEAGAVWWVANSSTGKPVLSGAAPLANAAGTPVAVRGRARPSAGDCNGDGILDLLVGDAAGSLHFYRGTPQGLAEPVALPVQLSHIRTASPTIVDYDADGSVDILLGDEDGFVSLHQFTAEGLQFSGYLRGAQVPFDVGRYAAVTAADYDGDGATDILAGGASGYIWVCFKRGEAYQRPCLVTDVNRDPIRAGDASEATPCAWPRLVDINGDGSLDLVVGNAGGTVQLWLNQGGLRYAGHLKMAGAPITASGLSAIELLDYDDDGDPDLFIGTAPIPAGDATTRSDSPLPQFVMPEGGLMYFENVVPKGGGMPVFNKGVRLLGFLGDGDETSARLHAGLLGLRYAEPLILNRDKWSFLVGTARGWFHFDCTNQRWNYPTLALPGDPASLPRALIPPCYSMTAVRPASARAGSPNFGLLCGTGPYGFCCYYPAETVAPLLTR